MSHTLENSDKDVIHPEVRGEGDDGLQSSSISSYYQGADGEGRLMCDYPDSDTSTCQSVETKRKKTVVVNQDLDEYCCMFTQYELKELFGVEDSGEAWGAETQAETLIDSEASEKDVTDNHCRTDENENNAAHTIKNKGHSLNEEKPRSSSGSGAYNREFLRATENVPSSSQIGPSLEPGRSECNHDESPKRETPAYIKAESDERNLKHRLNLVSKALQAWKNKGGEDALLI